MDAIRLVAIAESVAGAVPAAGAVESRAAGRDVLDLVMASRLQGTGADSLDRVLASRLARGGPGVRWGIGAGIDEESATRQATLALRSSRERGTGFGFATGDPWRDALLDDLALALAALLDDLTPRQAQIAGLVLVERARQAQVAETLGVSRATVSVAVSRGRLPAIAAARRAIEALLVGPPNAGHAPGAIVPAAAVR